MKTIEYCYIDEEDKKLKVRCGKCEKTLISSDYVVRINGNHGYFFCSACLFELFMSIENGCIDKFTSPGTDGTS